MEERLRGKVEEVVLRYSLIIIVDLKLTLVS